MVTEGWKPPTKRDEKGKAVLKPEEEFDDVDYQIMGLNAKAMNAIFSTVDMNVFKLISICDKANDAWDILQTTFEGTSSVRISREKLADFNAKICDIANESFALGDAISEEKLVRKVLRSLPKRFAYKVTAIEEAKDMSKMKLQERMGSLRTFEMGLMDEETSIALLIKNFSKFVKRHEKSSQNNYVKNRFSKPRRTKDEDPGEEKLKEVKCRECDGLGHYQAKCANTLKKKNKSYSSTLSESDDPDDSGSDEECVSNHIAFMTHSFKEPVPNSVSDRQNDKVSECSDDEEFTEESAIEAYKKLHESWIMVVKANEGLMKENGDLIKERDSLSMRLSELQNDLQQSRNNTHSQNGELLHLKKLVKMMNSGSSQLDDILSKGKNLQDHTGLGYTGGKRSSSHSLKSHSLERLELSATTVKSLVTFDHTNIQKDCSYQSVTFGDSVKGRVLGRGYLNVEGMPNLEDVLLVEGLKANLIGIIQLCDQGLLVHFTRDKCLVKNKKCVLLIDGDRSRDNCYLLNMKGNYFKTQFDEIDEESIDVNIHVPTSVPDSSEHNDQPERQNLCKIFKTFSLWCLLFFIVRTPMADKVVSSKPSQAKKPRISTQDLRRQLAELSQPIFFSPTSASIPTPEKPSVSSPEALASVPASVAPPVVSQPRSVSETDLPVQPSPRVSEGQSSPSMVSAEILDASIAAVIENVGGSEVSLAPDEDVATASAVGEESTSIEEFAASLDALNFVQAPSLLAVTPVFSDTPIVTVQVPLGEVSPTAANKTLDHGQGEEDVDISFLDEDSPVLEDVSVSPQPSQKATSSKSRGSKCKLELRDVSASPLNQLNSRRLCFLGILVLGFSDSARNIFSFCHFWVKDRRMGVELLEIGVKVRKGVIFIVGGCFRSVCNHPFLVGMLCFLIFLYRSSPFIFQLLVSASPILVCTAVLLGTLLSFGQPNIPEIEKEEKTTFEAVSIKTGVLGDTTVVEKNESHYVERLIESRWDKAEKSTELPELSAGKLGEVRREEDSDDTAPLIEERSQENELSNGENWGAKRELGDLRFKEKTEWIEERLNNGGVGENHHSSAAKVNGELESDDDKSEADSFDSEKVNVDSLDSPPRSPWARVEEREDEEAESEKEQDEDEDASDSGSDCAESSSPDASMADIMPMLDELHPLLDQEAPQTVHLSRGSSDAASEKSLKSSASNHLSDNESENHEDLEVADDENEDVEDEEDAQGDKDEETKSAIIWTEEDQKNLMDLGSSEIERNQRLENLILRRRARKTTNLFAERNLIDLESSDLPFNIAPISTRRQNPFDLPHDYYDNSLPPIPGSAPSVLLQRRNPFDIPYDSSEEKPDLKGDVFQEEFASQSKESFFRRHESFNLGPSIFAPKKQDVKMRPYFIPEGTISEESSSSLFQRQSSELSDSKVSSIPETESITSVEDVEDKKFPEREYVPEREVVEQTKEITEESPYGVPEMISRQEVDTEEDVHREEVEAEEDVHQEPEMFSQMESVSELIAHGSQSSEEEASLELGQVEKRDVQVGEFESQLEDVTDHCEQGSTTQYVEVQDFGYGSNFEAVEPRYTRVSSSSSLSEVSERVFIDTEGEGLSVLEGRRDDGADEPSISTRTSLGSTDLNITSALVNNISHTAPVYDSSPRELCKNVSSSSICSDVLPESDLGLPPVLDKIAVSSNGRESEGSSRETEMDIPHNIEMLLDSSTSHPVAPESRPVDVVDIREHDIVNTDFSEVGRTSISEGSSAVGSFAPHMSIPLRSSGEALMEEHLMEKHILDEVSVSIADKNIHTVARSSEDQDLEQPEDKHLLLSGRHGLTEASETQLEGLPREHSNAVDETVQSPSSEADIQHETDEKLTSILSAEGNTSLFYDNAIQEPDFNYLNEVQASSTPVESLDGQITWDLNMPDVQQLDRYINSPSSPKFISVPPSAIETYSSTVDVQTVVEEVDEIKEIDDGLLCELDNVGDFSVGQLAFGTSEFEKHVDYVGEENLPSTHRAEVKKIEHLLHSEESREHIDVYEQDLEHSSEPQTYETSTAANIEVSRKESDENDRGSPYQETSGEETPRKENEVLPCHSLVNNKHRDTVSGIPEVEVGSIENVGVVAEKAELVSVETEVMVGVAKVSCQGQDDTDSTSGMPELKASSTEDINLAFKQISTKEIEKHFVLDPPQPELQNHEDTVSKIPEHEVLSIGDVDAVPKKPESTSVETEFVVGVAEVSSQGQVDTDTTSGIVELEASTVENIDLALKRISSEEIEEPLVLEQVDTDTPSQIPELEASKTEDIDLAFQQISSKEIEKHVVLEPPQDELHNYENTDSELSEQEVQLAEDVHAASKHTELASVETGIVMEGADVSSQGQVSTDTTSETTEFEGSRVEEIDLAFEQTISKAIEKPVDLEPVDTDATSGMPEIEANSIEAINLAFEHIGSEEINTHDVLEPHQPELVAGETITDNSEDTAPHGDTSVPVSMNETSVLEVGPSKDATMDEQLTGSSELHDSVDITENSDDVVLHRDRSVMAATNVTSVVEVGPNKDAILDDNKLTESVTGTDRLHDSGDRTLHVVESGEEQGASSELHVAEVVPSEDTTLPPNQVMDGEMPEQLKLKSDDESVEVKAGDKIVLSEENSSVKESSAFVEAEKPNHEDEAPKDLHSSSSVKGKGKISRSSSSSSSSSSDSSSSDSDRE
ncbi:hypothetical protein C2S52_010766 [Perilla frutescens var. hirtella]|nr:hypothetical protein C2S52_010766 [Perilla frutescens var. hirtella]